MKTIILCGGTGYRLREETEFKPKPMIKIGNYPILWHIMKIYSHYGYNDFLIALGYKGDMIKDYFLNHKYYSHDFTLDTKTGLTRTHWRTQRERDNFKITFVDTGLETLTAGRVLKLMPYLKGEARFMLTYGDGVGDVNIKDVVKFHQKLKQRQRVIGTIVGVQPVTKWGLIQANKDHIINKFKEKPPLSQYVNGGFMVLEKKILQHFRPNEQVETSLERVVAQKQKLGLYIHDKFWHAMDTYKDMEELNHIWNTYHYWKVWS